MTERSYKAEGLVLRTRILGEADRLITLLTWHEGKFQAVARGARKIKSKLAAGVEIFTHGCFTLYRGKTWPVITGLDTIEQFCWFRENPDLYPYGIYMAELVDRLVFGEESCAEICQLLVDGWKLLGKDESIDRAFLCRAFELKLAAAAGYRPNLDSCTCCGSGTPVLFSPRQGGLLCSRCQGAEALKIEQGTVAIARRIIETPLLQAALIRPSVSQKEELDLAITAFMVYHLDLGEVKSRRLLPYNKAPGEAF